MIRRTIQATQAATFCVLLPHPTKLGMPTPTGTGFFVSPDGWFVTAAHVVTENNEPDGPPRKDMAQCWLEKEPSVSQLRELRAAAMCESVSLHYLNPGSDFALLKVDFQANANKDWLRGRTNFPFIQVSIRDLEEGEPVYSFGYPLPEAWAKQLPQMTIGGSAICPRVTAAIVSSALEHTKMVMSTDGPRMYVLDRALNYGNSGGPIVAVETGNVHAFCSRFQEMYVPQPHLKDSSGQPLEIFMPSLYGIVSSMANAPIVAKLREVGVDVLET